MKIYLHPTTVGRTGGPLNGNLKYLDSYIQSELDRSGFQSSFDGLWFGISFMPLYISPGIANMEEGYRSFYDSLPYSRLNRKNKTIDVTVKAPEFAEHFQEAISSKKKAGSESATESNSKSETELAQILLDKYLEVADVIRSKLKKDDVFDHKTFKTVIESIRPKLNADFLISTSNIEHDRQQQAEIEIAENKREERRKSDLVKDTLIRDIRLYFNYDLPKKLFYLRRYAEIVLGLLIRKNFLCPHYHHLYIRIANTKEEAIINAFPIEDWHIYGIAVLKEEVLLHAAPSVQQSLVLNALKDGLLDIAELDKLDKTKIIEAIKEAEEIGILSEILFRAKENNKIAFVISTKTIFEHNEDEIFFTILDKQTNRIARWKFGQENIFTIAGWFKTINLTNKKITIKPRANMDLVLEGKQKIIELDVEKELADPVKIVLNQE